MNGHNSWVSFWQEPLSRNTTQEFLSRDTTRSFPFNERAAAGFKEKGPQANNTMRDPTLEGHRVTPYAHFRTPGEQYSRIQMYQPKAAEQDRTLVVPSMGYSSKFYYRK